MTITFLGTGTSQGIPVIGSNHPVCLSDNPKDKRLRTSLLIQWGSYDFLIDCGPDFRQQMLRENCQKLDGILFTHEHADHTMGLDDIRPFYFRQGEFHIFAHKRVLTALSKRFDYIFTTGPKYPGVPSVDSHEIKKNLPLNIGNKMAIPISGMHHKLQVFGFRMGQFAYLTDMNFIEPQELEKLKELDVLVINALRKEPHISHFTLEEALAIIEKLKPKKAYLTHLSNKMGFHDVVQNELPSGVFLAYDGLKLHFKN